MNVIVDIQGFKDNNNKFIVKEAAVLSNGDRIQHFVFQPPYNFGGLQPAKQREAKWMENNHHKFSWKYGFTPYHKLNNLMWPLLRNNYIYVKGLEKQTWMKEIFGDDLIIYNLEEDMECPKLAFLKYQYPNVHRCIVHEGVCALENVLVLGKYMQSKNYNQSYK